MTRLLVGRVSKTRSKTMSAIKSKGSRAEKALEEALRSLGLKFETHADDIPGRPDVVFREARLIVFCDGDFWHGRKWKERKDKSIRVRREYWIKKIEGNICRDRKNNRLLRKLGWTVIRLWETDILKRPVSSVRKIQKRLNISCELTNESLASARAPSR